MKFDPVKSVNYVATIVRVPAVSKLKELDNLGALNMFGMQALIPIDTEVGTLGVLFSTEVQLSEAFVKANNLYRHAEKNEDKSVRGYLEDNRRVKAIKLRGVRSDSLFMPLSAFDYLGVADEFREGDVFDSINGKEILRKYVIREPNEPTGPKARVRRIDMKQFPTHIDTENFWRNVHKLPDRAPITVSQKLHGTSVRYANILVEPPKVPWYVGLLRKLGVPVQTAKYSFVVGSRMVVKSIDGYTEDGKQHYYGDLDLWTEYADRNNLANLIPPGYLVYGELIGKTFDGGAIQPDYTYGYDEPELFVYRVATITRTGVVTDLSVPAAKTFASGIGLKFVPTLWTGLLEDFDVDQYMDKDYYSMVFDETATKFEDMPVFVDAGQVDEGVCIRYDGPNGVYILKAKSPIFVGHESAVLDAGTTDIESEESA